ncbi:MAG: lipopolysaccharide biosynthesis protein [Flammeovirgaceae bacterium]|nr:MAG: lipopolysaccharide biosynthesis protein [Flammeovirgaceae bacterium]
MSQLRQKATQSFLWDMLSIFAKQGVSFIVSVFLARLLLPAEFGLAAMALVFITISQVFADFGLASALVQNKENTSLTYSSVFYFNLIIGLLLFVFFWLLAPFIAAFYDDARITMLVRYLSLGFIINGFNLVQQTILRRNLEFKKITLRAFVAQFISGSLAIVLAYRGWGVYALVVQNLTGAAIGTALLWQVTEWKPKLEFSWPEIKKLSGFSTYVFLNHVTTKLASQLDTLVVGKVFSAATLGFYSRATSLNSLVTTFSSTSISRVSFPVLSRLQDDPLRFTGVYFKLLEFVAFVSFGLSGALIFAGGDLITILFGRNWEPSVIIFQVLVLKSFTYPVSLLIVSAFWAAGKAKESFWFGNAGKTIGLLPLVVAIVWGFTPFLYSVVVASILSWLFSNWSVTYSFRISFIRQCKIIGLYFLLFASISLFIFMIVDYVLSPFAFPLSGILTGGIFAAIYISVNFALKTAGHQTTMEYLLPVLKQAGNRLFFINKR